MSITERRIILLGSTGSIGTQTVDVITHLNALAARGEWPVRYLVVGLAAGRNASLLTEQAKLFPEARLAIGCVETASKCAEMHKATDRTLSARFTNAHRGQAAALELIQSTPCDMVLGAMVGASGLPATLEAVTRGIDVALANKETLVAAGEIVVRAANASGARLLPVDSEHSALWQCLVGSVQPVTPAPPFSAPPATVAKLVLTASGGPFRTWAREAIRQATPAQALKHPTWTMGQKVTIDSASLTNKALEVIEAHWLYAMPAERIDVLVHPQSIVHSFVEYTDGSVIAQLGSPDMRCPIQFALSYPHRADGACRKLDWRTLTKLDFEAPDLDRFPALGLAYDVIRAGGTSGAIFNAANEEAVEAFLASANPGTHNRSLAHAAIGHGGAGIDGSTDGASGHHGDGNIPFGTITDLSIRALKEVGISPLRSLDDVLAADAEARRFVRKELGLR